MRDAKRTKRKQDGGAPVCIAPPVWDKDPYPCIHPGRYLVCVVGWQGPEWMRNGNRWSLRLECALFDEPVTLSLFFNFGGTREGPGIPGRQSKYYRHWVMANGEPPKKHEAMDWRIFVGSCFTAEVENVTKNSDGQQKCSAEVYSRISRFVRFEESYSPPGRNHESVNHESGITQSSNQVINQSREPC